MSARERRRSVVVLRRIPARSRHECNMKGAGHIALPPSSRGDEGGSGVGVLREDAPQSLMIELLRLRPGMRAAATRFLLKLSGRRLEVLGQADSFRDASSGARLGP